MTFHNAQIQVEDIPHKEDITFEPLEINYKRVLIYQNAIFFIILFLVPTALFIFEVTPPWVYLLVAGILTVFALLTFSLINRSYRAKGIGLRERDIVYRSGWLFKSITAIPFNRIQHVEINQGPLEKRFDLAKLEIFTAGGSESDLKIPGLNSLKAHNLRDFIIGKTEDYGEEE